MQVDSILYIIIAGILALFLALFQYVYKSKSKINWFLVCLRFISVFSVLVLLINPKFEKITYYNEKPNLIVGIDNSESLNYLNQNENAINLLRQFQSNDSLNTHFNIEYYSFGKELNVLDSLSFNEKQSNLATLFEELNQVYNKTIAPTIVITDGNQTYGNDYEYAVINYKQPVFPIILGDTTQYADIKIQQLNVNKYAYLKNKFPVEIFVVYNGESPITTQLKISNGNSTIFSEPISLSKLKSSAVINTTIEANKVGVMGYKVEVEPLPNEKNSVNNVKRFAVEVIDQKTNVAVISEFTHPDLGALKKTIESNEQRYVEILTPNEFLLKSNEFQLAIIYQPTTSLPKVLEEIKRLNLNVFWILGSKTNWNSVNEVQSNFNQKVTNQIEDFQATLNPNYSSFIIEDLNFNDFPPLQSEFGETKINIPFETIVYKTINGTPINEPLFATYEYNTKREAVLFGEGLWRWRAQSYLDQKSFNSFDNLLGKVVQYLGSTQRKSRLNIDYESFYNGNDDVSITAQYFNKNYEFDNSATITITLKELNNQNTKSYPFVLKNNNYQVDLSGLEAGEYSFVVSVQNENISKSGELKILDYNVEQQFLNANVTKLQQLATNTNGTAYYINNIKALADNLLNDVSFKTIQKSSKNIVPLIDWKYLLALIILSLALEWFIRKYNGLI